MKDKHKHEWYKGETFKSCYCGALIPMKPSMKDKIDEIITEYGNTVDPQGMADGFDRCKEKLLSLFKTSFMEIVGEDEDSNITTDVYKATRNDFRAELRERIERL